MFYTRKGRKKMENRNDAKPLGVILDEAKAELTQSVVEIQKKHGIPASLLDFIILGILAEVRELKSREYSLIGNMEVKDGRDKENT